jgi:hypothetical protein
MIEIKETTTELAEGAQAPRRFATGDISARLAGAGALTFAVTVIAQNLIRGVSAPMNDASSSDVLSHYADHRGIMFVLLGTYVLGGLGMAVFLGGAMRRLLASSRPGWAFTGLFGAAGVVALFSVVVGAEQALVLLAHQHNPAIGGIEAVWALHNSVFTVLDLSIAVALLGLSRAGIAAGITPAAFTRLAPIGSGLLLVGTLAGPAIAAGDAMALFGMTGVGFLVWLAFLITTGLRLVRAGDAR